MHIGNLSSKGWPDSFVPEVYDLLPGILESLSIQQYLGPRLRDTPVNKSLRPPGLLDHGLNELKE